MGLSLPACPDTLPTRGGPRRR